MQEKIKSNNIKDECFLLKPNLQNNAFEVMCIFIYKCNLFVFIIDNSNIWYIRQMQLNIWHWMVNSKYVAGGFDLLWICCKVEISQRSSQLK